MENKYIRLLRLHQPAGILLLLWPCLWSISLNAKTFPDPVNILIFIIGAFAMRSFGCIINDLIDKEIDAKVERTKTRPLASGEISPIAAKIIASALLAIGIAIAIYFGFKFILWAAAAIPLLIIYPYAKRRTFFPQLLLGVTFNWGALLGSVAVSGEITGAAVLLYLGGIFWTMGYDTIYAYQDVRDDTEIGIKSTAVKFGDSPHAFIAGFYIIALIGLALAGTAVDAKPVYFISIALFYAVLFLQMFFFEIENKERCMLLFRLNAWFGVLPFIGAMLAFL